MQNIVQPTQPAKGIEIDLFKAILVTYTSGILLEFMPAMKDTLLYSSKVEKELDTFTTIKIRNFWSRDKSLADQAFSGQKMVEKICYAITSISQQPEEVQHRFDTDLQNLLVRYGVNMFEMENI